jgi:hypothetical protein
MLNKVEQEVMQLMDVTIPTKIKAARLAKVSESAV